MAIRKRCRQCGRVGIKGFRQLPTPGWTRTPIWVCSPGYRSGCGRYRSKPTDRFTISLVWGYNEASVGKVGMNHQPHVSAQVTDQAYQRVIAIFRSEDYQVGWVGKTDARRKAISLAEVLAKRLNDEEGPWPTVGSN
jgi:hypothetical protein